MRESNNFIMDLMSFPKTVDVTNNANSNTDNTIATDLEFHNALFTDNTGPEQTHNHERINQQNHGPPKTTVETENVYMPLNGDFLIPVTKSYTGNTVDDTVHNIVEGTDGKVVQQLILTGTNVALDVSDN